MGAALWAFGKSNELFVDECDFWEDGGWACHTTEKTGTALHLDSNDHSIANTVIACTRQGIIIRGGATVVRNAHIYTIGEPRAGKGTPGSGYSYPNGCAYVPGTGLVRFIGCYFDGCPVFIDDAAVVEVTDSLFLFTGGPQFEATYAPIVLTATTSGVQPQGLLITNNLAGGSPILNFSFIRLNESIAEGRFFESVLPLRSVAVHDNSISSWDLDHGGIVLKATRASGVRTYPGPTDTFEVDLMDVLLFRQQRIADVVYSLELPNEADWWTPHALVSASNGLVVVKTQRPVANATIRVRVDQSIN